MKANLVNIANCLPILVEPIHLRPVLNGCHSMHYLPPQLFPSTIETVEKMCLRHKYPAPIMSTPLLDTLADCLPDIFHFSLKQ